MRIVIQRVKSASVTVQDTIVGQIGQGVLVFLGIAKDDTQQQADYLINKLIELRIFDDAAGKMNVAAKEVNASFLVVSQFTLYGNCDKGRRPSFDEAAAPAKAEELYHYFVEKLKMHDMNVQTGQFRAMMDVQSINDGPVTFVVDSK